MMGGGGGGGGGARKVRVEEIVGKGKGVVASEDIRGGEIILTDSPILVYPATALKSPYSYCFHCFRRRVVSCPCPCPACSHDIFCSPKCLTQALSSSHTPWVCHSLAQLQLQQQQQDNDFLVQAYFLIAAYNLAAFSSLHFQILMSLQGQAQAQEEEVILVRLHSLIESLSPPQTSFGVSFQLTAALLAKDKLNAFGLMEPPPSPGVRAYAIYPNASFFNHDCLPNACRFDYLDQDPDPDTHNNTDIIIRALHRIPKGREICLSYFPVNLNYSSRQHRLLLDYAFTCICDRCQVEANWSDNDDEDQDDAMEEEEDAMEGLEEEVEVDNDNTTTTDFPHAYFFLRYMCNRDNCWGTLAPLPPSQDGTPSPLMECNVCANFTQHHPHCD